MKINQIGIGFLLGLALVCFPHHALARGLQLVLAVNTETNTLASVLYRQQARAQWIQVVKKRLDTLGIMNRVVQPQGKDQIVIQLPTLAEEKHKYVKTVLLKGGFVEFRMVHPDSDQLLAQGIVSPGYEVLVEEWKKPDGTKEITRLLVNKEPELGLTSKYIKEAYMERNSYMNVPAIACGLDNKGTELFARLTREHSPKDGKRFRLAIVVDKKLYSAPYIMSEIPNGRLMIAGNFDAQEAEALAIALESSCPIPIRLVNESLLEPSVEQKLLNP